MAAGTPLTDADRQPWLDQLAEYVCILIVDMKEIVHAIQKVFIHMRNHSTCSKINISPVVFLKAKF